MQNQTVIAASETLRQDHLRKEKLQARLAKIRARLMRKIRGGKKQAVAKKLESKAEAAKRDLQILSQIKKSIDALKQNILKTK